jgi:transcriptional regulator with XRE-family HTH domain
MLYDKEKIDALRRGLDISWNELARRAGISGPSMNAIKKGTTKHMRAETLRDLALALGVPMQALLKRHTGRVSQDLDAEALTVFGVLSDDNKQAILAAARVLAAQQKKR